ncbi:putative dehydrogenase [Candidatus Promineifilum breve]|uniref:Dehydrogenase n=1 Tax=Candidatus Promineifilum breve TaxID=1806508 RepID=A0A160T323_9CHLR|nr:NAD(P)-dependent oxidoreductase [Candidatus Promineifilum breve]CUS04561.2 putative dehydrogenase [Candidatus Promineifilum breve]
MADLHVHFDRPLTADEAAVLKPLLSPAIALSAGADAPADATILISGRPTREQLAAAPGLRAVVIPWAGLPGETRDLLADFPGVAVHNLHHNAAPVAELALMLLLAAAKFALRYDRALRAGDWRPRYERATPALLLDGKTALILGYGAIGRRVAAACRALGMTTLATRRRLSAPAMDEGTLVHPPAALADLLPRAEALIICLPHTPRTDGLLGAAELGLLPSHSVLVNIGRGRIVDEAALYAALRDGRLRAAGLDVWYSYPPDEAARAAWPPSAYPFHELDNVIMSPHRGGAADETARLRMTALAAMLNDAARGREMGNRVDVEVGY